MTVADYITYELGYGIHYELITGILPNIKDEKTLQALCTTIKPKTMIDPIELRLNNIVQIDGIITTVSHIMGDEDYFEPVELTPEILEAAGCVKDIIDGWNLWINGNLFVIRKLVSAKGYTLSVGDYCLCDIEYLHTFQNAYNLLTGQELQIDVNKLNK